MLTLKKYWPFILLFVVILFVIGLVLLVRGSGNKGTDVEEEGNVAEVPVDQRPVTMLVPRADGHWLDLSVQNINVQGASVIEYEFTYTTTDGRSQGTGGTQPFTPGDNFESEILIGTTSSGKYYYDEGVEQGELTLKFRNDSGKLVGKLVTPWNLRHEPESVEYEGFTFAPEDADKLYVVAMDTFGPANNAPGNLVSGPVGFFASDETEGEITAPSGKLYMLDNNEWTSVDQSSSTTPGIFVVVSE